MTMQKSRNKKSLENRITGKIPAVVTTHDDLFFYKFSPIGESVDLFKRRSKNGIFLLLSIDGDIKETQTAKKTRKNRRKCFPFSS